MKVEGTIVAKFGVSVSSTNVPMEVVGTTTVLLGATVVQVSQVGMTSSESVMIVIWF